MSIILSEEKQVSSQDRLNLKHLYPPLTPHLPPLQQAGWTRREIQTIRSNSKPYSNLSCRLGLAFSLGVVDNNYHSRFTSLVILARDRWMFPTEILADGLEECNDIPPALPQRQTGNCQGTEKAPDESTVREAGQSSRHSK